MADYEFHWEGLQNLTAALDRQKSQGLERRLIKKHTAKLMAASQEVVPVDTGNLRRSARLTIKDNGLTGEVSYGASYAGYVEFGTRFMYARKYLGTPFMAEKMAFIEDARNLTR